MNNKVIIGIMVVVLAMGSIYLLTQKQHVPVQQQSQSTTNQPTAAPNTITIKDFAFNPDILTVKQGSKITWINEDSATHTIKSDAFNSQNITQGNKFEFTFSTKGSFDYSCGIHPSMKGKVIVE